MAVWMSPSMRPAWGQPSTRRWPAWCPATLVMAEIEVVGSLAYLPNDFDEVIAAMARGHYDPTGWVAERPVDDVVRAIHDLRDGTAMKLLIAVR